MTSMDISYVDDFLENPKNITFLDNFYTLLKGFKCSSCEGILFGDIVSAGDGIFLHKKCPSNNVNVKEADPVIRSFINNNVDHIPTKCICGEVIIFKNLRSHMTHHCCKVQRNCKSNKFGCNFYGSLPETNEHEQESCNYRYFHDLAEKYEERIQELEDRLEAKKETKPIIQSGKFDLDYIHEESKQVFFEEAFESTPKVVIVRHGVIELGYKVDNLIIEEITKSSFKAIIKPGYFNTSRSLSSTFQYIAHL